MSWLGRLIGASRDSPPKDTYSRTDDTTTDALLWAQNLWSVPSVTGIQINQQTALNATAVMACATMLAEDVAKLPWALYRKADDETRKEATDHWLSDLLETPNEWQSSFEFKEQMQLGLILRGNAYAVMIRDGRGRVVKFVPINPDWVALWEAPNGDLLYRVTPSGLHLRAQLVGLPWLIPFEDMFHLRGFSMNGLLGASRIALAKEAIALCLGQEQMLARLMGNGARPSGMFTTDAKLTEDAAKRLAARIRESFSGLQNAGKVMVGEQGLTWKPMAMTAADAQFQENRVFQLQEIARIFRIPPHMIGELTRGTQNSVVQQSQEYINFTLTGYTLRWQAKFSSKFDLKRQKLSVEHDYSALTRADMAARYNAYRTGIMSMFLTPDEARIDDGRPPIGGDAAKLHMPMNMAAEGSQSTGTQPDGGGRPPKIEPDVTLPRIQEMMRSGFMEMWTRIEQRMSTPPQHHPVVNVTPQINMPDIRVEQPVIHVSPPNVTSAPVNVNVKVMRNGTTIKEVSGYDEMGRITSMTEREISDESGDAQGNEVSTDFAELRNYVEQKLSLQQPPPVVNVTPHINVEMRMPSGKVRKTVDAYDHLGRITSMVETPIDEQAEESTRRRLNGSELS